MRIDLHVHSTASDGTCAPCELAAAGARGGFAAMALTDHDNADGADEFTSAGAQLGLRTAVGVELSVEPGEGFDRFHLLALGVDPANAALRALLKKVLDGRNGRNAQIAANFLRLGIDLRETIGAYAHGEVLARPHFAQWLVDRGYAADVTEAFANYLLPESPAATRCYEERWRPSQEEAFAAVHAAGGLCVMAHPKYWRRGWKVAGCDFGAARRGLAAVRERGLDGLEALYQANRPEENVEFSRMADALGLLKTAGSDFHGAHKPAISLGMEVSEAFAAPVLERLFGTSLTKIHAAASEMPPYPRNGLQW